MNRLLCLMAHARYAPMQAIAGPSVAPDNFSMCFCLCLAAVYVRSWTRLSWKSQEDDGGKLQAEMTMSMLLSCSRNALSTPVVSTPHGTCPCSVQARCGKCTTCCAIVAWAILRLSAFCCVSGACSQQRYRRCHHRDRSLLYADALLAAVYSYVLRPAHGQYHMPHNGWLTTVLQCRAQRCHLNHDHGQPFGCLVSCTEFC